MNEEKSARTVSVSFTKISDDVIVPTWRVKGGDGVPFKISSLIWWALGAFWLLCMFASIKTYTLNILSGSIITGFTLFLGLMFQIVMKNPQKWVELNRKDASISVWTSRKKHKRIGRWYIDKVAIKMNRRWVASSPRSGENRYLIELFDNDPEMKNTPFWKFDNHPQKKGVPFFVLFDLFNDPHSNDEDSDRTLAWAISHRIEKFIRDFMAGRPLPESSTGIYTFSVPE